MDGNKDESMWPLFILATVVITLVIQNKIANDDIKKWINDQDEAEADNFLNQVKNHLAETRPFER